MATKDITTGMVLVVVSNYRDMSDSNVVQILESITKQPTKVCVAALNRELHRNNIEFGTSINYPWLTDCGKAKLKECISWDTLLGDNR